MLRKSISLATAALLACGAAGSASVPGQGTWQATLQPRDFDRDGVADAYYDTDLRITWAADAGLAGPRTFEDAIAWVRALELGGQTGWRLPTLQQLPNCNPDPPPFECLPSVVAGTSELEHLYARTLGNGPGSVFNTGPFRNLQQASHFTDQRAVFTGSFQPAWTFDMGTGRHDVDGNFLALNAWAVHVGSVPEPGTWVLMLGGLLAIGGATRRKRRSCGAPTNAKREPKATA